MTTTVTPVRATRGFRLRLAALSLAMVLPSLGTSIANVALPTLSASFQAPVQDVQWVVISYLLAVTTLIVGAGRLGDMLGRRRVLLFGVGVFTLASASAVFAGNLWVLIALRAVQGLGAAIMMSLTIASVGDMVPKDRTGSVMGLLGTVSAFGTALGPSFGGLLISAFGWPAVFAFMAAAGIAAFVFGSRVFPADVSKKSERFSFDLPGMMTLGLSLGAFALSTTMGGANPGMANAALAIIALVGLTAFVVIESRTAVPLVHMSLLRNRALARGLISMMLVSTIMMATLVVGPFYLSGVLGLGPVQTGLTMSLGPGVAALMGVPAGRLVDGFGETKIAASGLLGVSVGSVLMTLLPDAFGVAGYIAGLATITAGYALFQAANTTAVMNGASTERRGVTSSLLGLSRNLGLITGASAMGAVFTLGNKGAGLPGLATGGAGGLQLTFSVATILASIALVVILAGRQRS